MILSDKLIELWESSLSGNQNDFASLHHKIYPKLFIYAVNMIRDHDLVDDLLQDLFIKFWEKRERIGQLKNVEAYFYRATRSAILNHIRQNKYRESKLSLMEFPGFAFSAEEEVVSSESDLQMKQTLLSALNSLPIKQKEILKMRFYDEMGYPEIADVLGIKYQSVINHVYRATQSLRQIPDLSEVYAA